MYYKDLLNVKLMTILYERNKTQIFCYQFFSLRAKFALEETKINMLHGSDSEETAKKELEFFFPMEQTVAVIKPDAVGTKGKKHDLDAYIAVYKRLWDRTWLKIGSQDSIGFVVKLIYKTLLK